MVENDQGFDFRDRETRRDFISYFRQLAMSADKRVTQKRVTYLKHKRNRHEQSALRFFFIPS